jgi:hypothetical protein
MGLDITAYSKLQPMYGRPDDDAIHLYVVEEEFRARGAGIDPGLYALGKDGDFLDFRAGSYSGYNQWRRELSRLALGVEPEEVWRKWPEYAGKPFAELIHFADNEGYIGPTVAAKLAADFASFDEKAAAMPDSDAWFYDRYKLWRSAFELAADGGAVRFH